MESNIQGGFKNHKWPDIPPYRFVLMDRITRLDSPESGMVGILILIVWMVGVENLEIEFFNVQLRKFEI